MVVLDNASDDGSADAVRERFPSVRVIEQRFRAGFGANHNTVIGETTGRYVYVLNEDTVSERGALERMVDYVDAHPGWVRSVRMSSIPTGATSRPPGASRPRAPRRSGR